MSQPIRWSVCVCVLLILKHIVCCCRFIFLGHISTKQPSKFSLCLDFAFLSKNSVHPIERVWIRSKNKLYENYRTRAEINGPLWCSNYDFDLAVKFHVRRRKRRRKKKLCGDWAKKMRCGAWRIVLKLRKMVTAVTFKTKWNEMKSNLYTQLWKPSKSGVDFKIENKNEKNMKYKLQIEKQKKQLCFLCERTSHIARTQSE